MNRLIISLSIAAALFAASPALADEASDLAAIKAQLGAMNAKIHSLEVRLAKAEGDAKQARAQAAKSARPTAVASGTAPSTGQTFDQPTTQVAQAAPAPEAPPQEVTPDVPPPPPSAPASNNAFNPGIAAVLNGFYVASSRDTQKQHIRGFATGDEAGCRCAASRSANPKSRSRPTSIRHLSGLPRFLDAGRQSACRSKKPISRPRICRTASRSRQAGSFRASATSTSATRMTGRSPTRRCPIARS